MSFYGVAGFRVNRNLVTSVWIFLYQRGEVYPREEMTSRGLMVQMFCRPFCLNFIPILLVGTVVMT